MISRWLLIVLLSLLVVCAWIAPVDRVATERLDAGLTRALTSFAAARALNAAISVAQGTEIALEPGGVGVNLTPGQILDPINDLVEQFSTLMLAASVAFGIQKMLVYLGAHWLLSGLLTIAAVVWVWPYVRRRRPPDWLSRALILLIMIRFAVPAVAIGTDLVFEKFMADDFRISESVIDTATARVAEVNTPTQPPRDSQGILDQWKDKASEFWSQTTTNLDIRERYAGLKQAAEQWAEHVVKLIVIFLMQTLVVPLLLVWIMFLAARALIGGPTSARIDAWNS